MALNPGSRLGPYEIIAAVGAGGMGEVYKARDTRLERTVALKVLNSSLAASPELKARFEREARAISQLNHPTICTLHDVGNENGIDYLVMEYIEGESLAERIKRGPLALVEMLRIAIDTVDAIERAHRVGIIHRDLKPGNIMLTKTGAKLLDFGLAKPVSAVASARSSTSAPSFSAVATISNASPLSSPLTSHGSIVGTIQYMSPEQIEGRDADARSDIFAFGGLLYEMVTGQRAFVGKSQIKVASAILEDDPRPIRELAPTTPSEVERVIVTCLAKNPDERFQCVADLKIQLQWIASTSTLPVPSGPQPAQSRSRIMLFAAVLASLLAVGFGAAYFGSALATKPVVHSYILPPDPLKFLTVGTAGAGAPFISPDGTKLAFIAVTQDGKPMLYVQSLNSGTAQQLIGTEGAGHPFWSPDSRYIGYFTGSELKRIETSGGPSQTLCQTASTNQRGGSWSPDGTTIIFGYGTAVAPISRVPAAGGVVTPVLKLKPGEFAHRWPQFLPDSKHFLFFNDTGSADDKGIYLASLDSPERKLVLRTTASAQYVAPGYLLFWREQELMAQPFDLRRLELTGEAVPIAEHVDADLGTRRAIFSASENGMLVFQTGSMASGQPLAWMDVHGKQLGRLGDPDFYDSASISPDGSHVAVQMGSPSEIWVFDLARGTKTRLTFGPGRSRIPIWAPDGKSILYTADRKGDSHIYRKPADNSGPEEVVLESSSGSDFATSFARDGRYLIYERLDPTSTTSYDLWVLPLFGDRKPFPIVKTQFTDITGSISPDGKWLAYANNESGHYQVYVAGFPDGKTRSQVSTMTGWSPIWRNDGRELFYLTEEEHPMAVDVNTRGGVLQLGNPHTILGDTVINRSSQVFATIDGKKFLVDPGARAGESSAPLTLISNWPGLLRK